MIRSSIFPLIANDIALDFVNTIIRVEDIDLLESPSLLEDWFVAAGHDIIGKISDQDFKRALELRAAIKTLVVDHDHDSQKAFRARATINEFLETPTPHVRLTYSENTHALEKEECPFTVVDALKMIAEQSATLLVETPESRIRKCANEPCVLVFKDTSKSQRRRWCSMKVCGNRAKVSTHYHKTKQA